jgi:hypothetical protein
MAAVVLTTNSYSPKIADSLATASSDAESGDTLVECLRDETRKQLEALVQGIRRPRIIIVIDVALKPLLSQPFLQNVWTSNTERRWLTPQLRWSDVLRPDEINGPETPSIAFLVLPTVSATVEVERLSYDIISAQRSYYRPSHGKRTFEKLHVWWSSAALEPAAPGAQHMSVICQEILNIRKLKPRLMLRTTPINSLIALDTDLLSLEQNHFFRDCFVDKDLLTLAIVAHSILTLDRISGGVGGITAVGSLAQRVLDIVKLAPSEPPAERPPGIDAVVILDRSVDLISPLLMPNTYEALLVELNEPNCGSDRRSSTKVGASNLETTTQSAASEDQASTHTDALITEIRDLDIRMVRTVLAQKSRAIKESFDRMSSPDKSQGSFDERQTTVREMKHFALDGGYTALKFHMDRTQELLTIINTPDFLQRREAEHALLRGETCNELLEMMMITSETPKMLACEKFSVLRLLCLQYLLAKKTIDEKQYDSHRREMIQTYGYDMLFTFDNIEKAGLLGGKSKLDWRRLRKDFGLQRARITGGKEASAWNRATVGTKELTEEQRKQLDPSNVFDGYAPLSVQIVKATTQRNWKECAKVLEQTNAVVPIQKERPPPPPPSSSSSSATRAPEWPPIDEGATEWWEPHFLREPFKLDESRSRTNKEASPSPKHQNKKSLVVFIVGGVTRAELAAFRALSRRADFPYRITCCTTNVTSGSEMLKDISVVLPEAPDREGGTGTASRSSDPQPQTGGGGGGEEGALNGDPP